MECSSRRPGRTRWRWPPPGSPRPATLFLSLASPVRAGLVSLTGGQLTLEDAYAYAKFAQVALDTNDIDMRARAHSAEEGALPGHLCGRDRHRQSATPIWSRHPRCCWAKLRA